MVASSLIPLYLPLLGWVGLGLVLGWRLPLGVAAGLGQLLFWVGVPISILGFLRQANLDGPLWLAPIAAWTAILLGLGLAALGMRWSAQQGAIALAQPATRGSFALAAMVGNTGYLGYPVSLALLGPDYFAWALFYDLLGSTLGAYGLGVVLAARWGSQGQKQGQDQGKGRSLLQALLYNPALWSFGLGLLSRDLPLPPGLEQVLHTAAWGSVTASLVLMGMRLSQLRSRRSVPLAAASLGIKMLLVPLLLGLGLSLLGIEGGPRLALVLQVAMPPAFATLVLCEAYHLDWELTVTALAIGSSGLLLLLPLWLYLFPA